jgi:hypothetical protein
VAVTLIGGGNHRPATIYEKPIICIKFNKSVFPMHCSLIQRSSCGRDRMVVGFTTLQNVQTVPITTTVVSSNNSHGKV